MRERDYSDFIFGLNVEGRVSKLTYYIFVRKDDFNVYAISLISADADKRQMMLKSTKRTQPER